MPPEKRLFDLSGGPEITRLQDLTLDECEALVEHNRKEAWVADRMAEAVAAGHEPKEFSERGTWAEVAAWRRKRAREAKRLAAEIEQMLDEGELIDAGRGDELILTWLQDGLYGYTVKELAKALNIEEKVARRKLKALVEQGAARFSGSPHTFYATHQGED